MTNKAEKICKTNTGPIWRRYLKRMLRRARRRSEKRDPENAPVRLRELTRGWSD